jgi:H+/gluconate symporter-like permease
MFGAANIPRRLLLVAVGLCAFTFTMSAMPETPSVNNAIHMSFGGCVGLVRRE